MAEDAIVKFVEKQEWLAPIQEQGSALVRDAFASAGETGQVVKNALHGVWLGHPLHSAITDVPIGSWTAAAVLDVLESSGRKEYAAGADAAIAVGLVGALGSALSGLADWSDIQGKPQRIGALHGLLNATATVLYGSSYALRKADKRGAARGLSFLGYAVVLGSAYLGGALSYTQRIGVNHAADPDEDLPKNFERACDAAELTENQLKKATVNGVDIVLLKRGNQIFALGEKCSHLGGPLSEGKVEGDTVQCPWHGSRFCLKTGAVVDGPATNPQPALEVQVRDGGVFVRAEA
jgi:nitrite reductase/ring-hydroxylating ferredoxin subunit/uncharacterized membrane protein